LSTEHPAPWQRSVRKRASTSESERSGLLLSAPTTLPSMTWPHSFHILITSYLH
jgi:hypothetical protein